MQTARKEAEQRIQFIQTHARPAGSLRFSHSGSGHIAISRELKDGRIVPILNSLGIPLVMAATPSNPRSSLLKTMAELHRLGFVHEWRIDRRPRQITSKVKREQSKRERILRLEAELRSLRAA